MDAMTTPTRWFLYMVEGEPRAAARWYYPPHTRVEGNRADGLGWQEREWFLEIHDEVGWQEVSEADVNTWLASQQISEPEGAPSR